MNHDQRSAGPAVGACATAPVGGLSSGDRSDRPGGDRGDGAAAAPATGPALSGAGSEALWAPWAPAQLREAARIADALPDGRRGATLAAELHRRWYSPALPVAGRPGRAWGPLAGLYRRAHAGAPVRVDGVSVIDRHDVLGRDGWWRTWGDAWVPTRSRRESVRVLLSPRPETLPSFVAVLTDALPHLDVPWLLSCPTDVRRLHRAGAVQLHVPAGAALGADLLAALCPLLQPVSPPLGRPLTGGVTVVEDPGSSPSFGVHRCRLVAAGLQHPGARRDPLGAVARAFLGAGLDPAAPHRTPARRG